MENKKIYVDGVDVSKCEFYMHYDYGKFSHGCSLHKDMFGLPVCCDIADCCKDCYFKQLKRKEQECEELKKEIKKLTTEYYRENLHNVDLAFKNYQIEKANQRQTKIANDLGKNMLKYEQALNEIEKQARINCEEICGKNYDTCKDRDCLTTLLKDIISKAKDGKNE